MAQFSHKNLVSETITRITWLGCPRFEFERNQNSPGLISHTHSTALHVKVRLGSSDVIRGSAAIRCPISCFILSVLSLRILYCRILLWTKPRISNKRYLSKYISFKLCKPLINILTVSYLLHIFRLFLIIFIFVNFSVGILNSFFFNVNPKLKKASAFRKLNFTL